MQTKDALTKLAKHPARTFLDLTNFNGYAVGCCAITGTSPVCEMHPDTDEFFYMIDGELSFINLTADSGQVERNVLADATLVVPQGLWHKPAAHGGAKFIYMTPDQSLHSDAADPRSESV